ncbi:MAG: DUF373 family protein [Candidatus Aramenus sp.]|nr:DUF373 family protein [Candidatus Aramenus sp.]
MATKVKIMETLTERTAVIYVDIDDDLGRIGVQTPVIGEKDAFLAIQKASEVIPDDSDFNAMVVTLNLYKKLKDKGNVDIVFIAGSEKGGIEAQLRLSSELDEVIRKLGITNAIVVYDSPEDAKAIPIIQSKLKITGIQRVIVEQYRGVEETYILIGRYLKKVITEPRYSRIFLGVPGIIFVIGSVFYILGLASYLLPAVLLVIGLSMLVRGFAIDDMIERWWQTSTIMVIVGILSLISLIIGIIQGYVTGQSLKGSYVYVSSSIANAMLPYLTFSVVILFAGKALENAIEKNIRVWHDLIKIAAIIVSAYIISSALYNIERGIYIIQAQLFYTLSVSSMIIIMTYIALTIIEKYKLT